MKNFEYLRFFNKRGEYCNFNYDSTLDKWTGRIDMQTISTGLFEVEQLYILEETYNTTTNQVEYTKPFGVTNISDTINEAYFDTKIKPVPEIAFFDINNTELIKFYSIPGLSNISDGSIGDANFLYPGIKKFDFSYKVYLLLLKN